MKMGKLVGIGGLKITTLRRFVLLIPFFVNLQSQIKIKTMKTLVSILLCTLLFSGNEVYSQQDSLNKKITYIIKTDLFFPVISFMARQTDNINQYGQSLTFETGFNQRQSFQITGLLMSFKGHENSWQVIPEYKFF